MSLPAKFYKEQFSVNDVKCLINLNGAEGNIEISCIELGIPCVSFCFTDAHVKLLYDRIEVKTFARMQDPNCKALYQKRLKALMGEKEKDEGGKEKDDKPKPKRAPKKKDNQSRQNKIKRRRLGG